MLKRLILSVALLLSGGVCLAQSAGANGNTSLTQQNVAPQDARAFFAALTATGQTPALSLVGNPGKPGGSGPSVAYVYAPKFIGVYPVITGSPATCSYTVYGTLKFPSESPVYPGDYLALSTSQTCTTAAAFFLTYVPTSQILISLTALTGGTSPTVTFQVISAH